MTTKKPEPQAEYDFRAGVRGKHHRAFPDGVPRNRIARTDERVKQPAVRDPKPIKG